jgi:glycosyltransferase involved in cell wall biosynthesis
VKILYISSSKIPSRHANSVHVMKMCQALANCGNEVTLLARKGEIENIEDDHDYYGVKKCFEIKKLSFSFSVFEKMIYLIRLFIYILKNKKKYQFIYGRFLYGVWWAFKMGVPFSYESHETPHGIISKLFEKSILKSSNLKSLVLISSSLKEIYKEIYPKLSDEKIIVAHDGADSFKKEKENTNNNQALKGKGELKAGYVGSLYKGRGIELIIQLAENLPSVDFHIIGGSESEVLQYKSRTKTENIYFYGLIPHSQVGDYVQQLDILLAPYQKEVSIAKKGRNTVNWMSPLKIFEYMAQEKPIICSNLPALKEVLENNRTALFCDPENIQEWINAINKLRNVDLRILLGRNAKHELENKYTWLKRVNKILNFNEIN